ncbi:MAG: excinuclease ABC subunit UvrC [Candidatus Omnitrophica bacterium]|nr:excinuclease ABC subunit UvrC [Candidatus Omnitrophota bacterium]MDE2232190.1 excinuclease ABC subunit UvrC [Candidatus Omnitrophota bacterium]
MEIRETIKTLPTTSGVYLYKDAAGEVIYVGKAVNIRKRVESYFRKETGSVKTDFLVSKIAGIETVQTASEAEALLLEAGLIKRHLPKYNVELKDGKTYPFIRITKEEFPLVSVVRQTTRKYKDVAAEFWGPYVNPALVREALNIIRKIFPFRTCEPFAAQLCLYYDLGLCQGPCEAKVGRQEYMRNIKNIKLILDGKKDDLYRRMRRRMEEASLAQDFEGAGRLRDQIRAVGALYSGTGDINYYKEAEQLQRALVLGRAPARLECFDISNIMGNQAVGSMVSFLNGRPDKNNYRRFRIKTVQGIDDFQMIAEVVRRRYSRLQREGLSFPDLIVVDGGKGQLGAALGELKKLNLSLPVIALAKQEEEIFVPGKRNPLRLPHDSLGLKLLMRLRDEAHRFGLKYHTLLRAKKFLGLDKP